MTFCPTPIRSSGSAVTAWRRLVQDTRQLSTGDRARRPPFGVRQVFQASPKTFLRRAIFGSDLLDAGAVMTTGSLLRPSVDLFLQSRRRTQELPDFTGAKHVHNPFRRGSVRAACRAHCLFAESWLQRNYC